MERRLRVVLLLALCLASPLSAFGETGPTVSEATLTRVPPAVRRGWAPQDQGIARLRRELELARSANAAAESLDAVDAARRDLRAALSEATDLETEARSALQVVQLNETEARIRFDSRAARRPDGGRRLAGGADGPGPTGDRRGLGGRPGSASGGTPGPERGEAAPQSDRAEQRGPALGGRRGVNVGAADVERSGGVPWARADGPAGPSWSCSRRGSTSRWRGSSTSARWRWCRRAADRPRSVRGCGPGGAEDRGDGADRGAEAAGGGRTAALNPWESVGAFRPGPRR